MTGISCKEEAFFLLYRSSEEKDLLFLMEES
jgi:hypothetical protein